MAIFYTPNIVAEDAQYSLPAEESKHCSQVLRMKEGAFIELVDGRGGYYQATVNQIGKKNTLVDIISYEQNYQIRPFSLTIAIAPTKNTDRFEWFLEKATEIGIERIIPIRCRYSERKDLRTERLNKVIISAMKQSKKAFLPKLDELMTLDELITITSADKKFIAHCYDGEKKPLQHIYNRTDNALILIGPEGDFSMEEIEKSLQNGFTPISLGNSRLRTETAGLVACHTVNMKNDW